MLTYTFSTREKIMLAALAFVGIIVVWYQLVFVNVQSQIAALDTQIASLQDEITINQSRATALSSMRNTVKGYQDQGLVAVLLPSYDNTQNLMAYLNGVLMSTKGYSMSFDNPEVSEEDGTVHRTGLITYSSGSYQEARSVADNIARGPYTCEINSLGITDNSYQQNSSSDAPVSTSLQVTFFEKVPANATVASSSSNEVQGQDLSKLSDWNK